MADHRRDGLTSVAGVWVAGNVANPRAQVITAAGEGSAAAIAINADLVDEDVRDAVRDFTPGARVTVRTSATNPHTPQEAPMRPTPAAQPASIPPPSKHQLGVMIWLGVFPTLTVINLTLGDWLRTLSPVVRTFVLATIAVPIVIYGLMPYMHRLRGRLMAARAGRGVPGRGHADGGRDAGKPEERSDHRSALPHHVRHLDPGAHPVPARARRPAGYIAGGGSDTRIYLGVFLELLLIVANIGTAVVPFPVFRRQDEILALGYVAARIMECVFILVGILAVLAIVSLRDDASADDASLGGYANRSPRSRTGRSCSGRASSSASGTG